MGPSELLVKAEINENPLKYEAYFHFIPNILDKIECKFSKHCFLGIKSYFYVRNSLKLRYYFDTIFKYHTIFSLLHTFGIRYGLLKK